MYIKFWATLPVWPVESWASDGKKTKLSDQV